MRCGSSGAAASPPPELDLAARARRQGAAVTLRVAQQLAGAEGLEADGAHAVLAGEGQDLVDIARVHERADREHRHVATAREDGGAQHVRVMARYAAEAGLALGEAAFEIIHAAAGCGEAVPHGKLGDGVEDEEVHRVEAEAAEAGLDLRGDGAVEVIDLVDDEHALTTAAQGGADDLLAVAVLVAGRGVDDVEAGVERAAHGGDAGFEGDRAIGEITDADHGGVESRAAERAARGETRERRRRGHVGARMEQRSPARNRTYFVHPSAFIRACALRAVTEGGLASPHLRTTTA
ncbi:MAG: hypothetical protein QM820_12940 [Minicystis sp.]